MATKAKKATKKTKASSRLSYADWKQRIQVVQLALRKGATEKQLLEVGVSAKTVKAARAYKAPKAGKK